MSRQQAWDERRKDEDQVQETVLTIQEGGDVGHQPTLASWQLMQNLGHQTHISDLLELLS